MGFEEIVVIVVVLNRSTPARPFLFSIEFTRGEAGATNQVRPRLSNMSLVEAQSVEVVIVMHGPLLDLDQSAC